MIDTRPLINIDIRHLKELDDKLFTNFIEDFEIICNQKTQNYIDERLDSLAYDKNQYY